MTSSELEVFFMCMAITEKWKLQTVIPRHVAEGVIERGWTCKRWN